MNVKKLDSIKSLTPIIEENLKKMVENIICGQNLNMSFD